MSSILRRSRFRCSTRIIPENRLTTLGHSIRLVSARQGAKQARSNPLSPIFTGFLVFGLGLTAYGLHAIYDAVTMWPHQIRNDLFRGLLAKRDNDTGTAISCLFRAWEYAKSMPIQAFGKEPHLKTSGLAISLASLLEEADRKEQAFQIYRDALLRMILDPSQQPDNISTDSLKLLTPAEKIRAVSIANKLGELANELQKPPAEEEKWLVWCVEALLKTVMQDHQGSVKDLASSTDIRTKVDELALPSWAMLHDFAAPFEALGSFYGRTGKIHYALPLYLQAISVLIPPDSRKASPGDKCRGAQLMGNIAELVLSTHPSDNIPTEVLGQAEEWVKKGLEVTQAARRQSFSRHELCEEAYAVLLYNLAMIKQFSGDSGTARKLLRRSLDQAKVMGMKEASSHAEIALRSLGSLS